MTKATTWAVVAMACACAGCRPRASGAVPTEWDASSDRQTSRPPLDAATDGSPIADATDTSAPGVSIPNICGSSVGYCEEAAWLGAEGGLGYGRGTAVVDIDGDGWVDIWRSDSGAPTVNHVLQTGALHNLGDGTFAPWDLGIPEADRIMNWAGVFADYDNDGDPDLFLVNGGYEGERSCALYRNDLQTSGRFTDVTDDANISRDTARWWGAQFGDYDDDGNLDLVLTGSHGDTITSPADVRLYHNRGDGTFEEVSSALGLPDPIGDVKNPVWIDCDRDGDLDLLIGRTFPPITYDDTVGLFENLGGTGFKRVDPTVFPGPPIADEAIFAFAVAVADFDQDGWDDVYLGRWTSQDYVALNRHDGTFELLGPDIGLVHPDGSNTMGLGVGDLTGDGFPDVFIGPGQPTAAYRPLALCNVGPEHPMFERCGLEYFSGLDVSRWHGVALGDLDRDFDNDLAWNVGGFFSHDQTTGDDTRDRMHVFVNHRGAADTMAKVELVGTNSPTTPLDARVRVETTPPHFVTLRGTQGFQSADSRRLLLPLEGASSAKVTVQWPSGIRESYTVEADRMKELVEGEGTPAP